MRKGKIVEYIFLIILFSTLFFNLFVFNIFESKYILCAFLLGYYLICNNYVKSHKDIEMNKKTVAILMIAFASIYVLILYIIGVFVGFYKNATGFSLKVLIDRIIPTAGIIVFSELIRNIFISRKDKKSAIVITICLVLIDVIMNINLYSFNNLDSVLAFIGYVVLSSLSINILGSYITGKYGFLPILIYRLITVLYRYTFSILPDIYLFFQSVFRIIYPAIMYVVIMYGFSKNSFKMARKDSKISIVGVAITGVISIAIVALVSCKFKYGIMVVGSSSMTGSIDKGDAVFFEKYEGQELEKGKVIIFNKDNVTTIHRIVDVQTLNNEKIYFTKGDYNQQGDGGYRTKQDISGVVDFRIIEIGWPTIWVNDLFKNK